MNDYLAPFFQRCRESDVVFFKVLSQNDQSWSWPKDRVGHAHQGGIVIPDNFTHVFPRKEIEKATGAHLVGDRRYYRVHTYWLDDDGEWEEGYRGEDWKRQSKFGRSYTDRGEFRVTGGLPRQHFRSLSPGSLFVCARHKGSEFGKEYAFSCLTVDAQSDAYTEFIQTMLIPDPPWAGLVDLRTFDNPLDLISHSSSLAEVSRLLTSAKERPVLIDPITTAAELSGAAVRNYESLNDGSILDLLRKSATPGDAIRFLMEESFMIVKEQHQRTYPAKVADLLFASLENKAFSRQALLASITATSEEIRSVYKSMQNSIFSLAGSCFQNYIQLWLDASGIPYDSQQKVDGDRKPDIILPSADFYWSKQRDRDDAILLAAKTSCRERWQQILAEGKLVDTRYLATLDNAIPLRTLGKMTDDRVIVIVPESQKQNLEHYRSGANVLDYRTLLKTVLIPKLVKWKAL